jgi:hypothetical protein
VGELGAGSELLGGNRFLSGRKPGNSLPAPSSAFAGCDYAGARAHLDRTGAWPPSGWLTCGAEHYCRKRLWASGGARDSKGSFAWQSSLSRWRRIRSTICGYKIGEAEIHRVEDIEEFGVKLNVADEGKDHQKRILDWHWTC